MKVGVKMSPIGQTWDTLETFWDLAGSSPAVDSVWAFDHLFSPDVEEKPCFECWTALALLAHRAPTKMLGHIVLAYNFRGAGLLAKMATAMDHGLRGRFVLGLGGAWFERENQAFGLPYNPSLPARLAELEEYVVAIKALFSAVDSASAVSTQGSVVLDKAINSPPPLTKGGPPIWLGTQGEKIGLRIVSRLADGWNFGGGEVEKFISRKEKLAEYCAEIGRDPSEITLSAQLVVEPDGWDTVVLEGQRLRDAGCDHVILQTNLSAGISTLTRLINEVAAPLHEA